MKNKIVIYPFLAVLVLFGVVFLSQLTAQVPTSASQTLFSGGSCAATTTVTRNLVIDCSKQASVGVQITFNMAAACNSNITFSFTRSVDGAQYDTTGFSVAVLANGTNTVSVLTNLPSYGANYIKLTTIANPDATTFMTNAGVAYGIKISAP